MKYFVIMIVVINLIACSENRRKIISGLEGKALPSFNMLLTDSTTYLDSKNIRSDQPFVIFYFNPNCPYCKAQTKEIKDEIELFKNIGLYFISPYPLEMIKSFGDHYSLERHTNITLAQIKDTAFAKYFKIPGVPYFAVYNKEKKLKEVMLGKVSVNTIKNIALGN